MDVELLETAMWVAEKYKHAVMADTKQPKMQREAEIKKLDKHIADLESLRQGNKPNA